jgi:hypothetical protein
VLPGVQEPARAAYCTRRMTQHASIECLTGCAVAALTATLLGLLLRSCGLRRSWVIGGLLAGALLGVQGLGRMDDRLFERFFMGAGAERKALFVAARSIEVTSMVAGPQGATMDEEQLAGLQAERAAAATRFANSRRTFDEDAAWVVAMLAAIVMVAASPMTGRTPWWKDGGGPVGTWCLAVPAGLLLVALSFSRDPEPQVWWMSALAIACLGAPALQARDRWTAVRLMGSRASVLDAARGMNGMCAIVLGCTAWILEESHTTAWLLPWATALAAWGLAAAPIGFFARLTGPATAAAVAIAVTRIDPIADWEAWFALAVFVAEDLKWIGAAFGVWLWGRVPWFASLRACMPMADTATAQAVLGALALLTGFVPVWIGYALLVSAGAVEAMEPLRRGTALRLDQAIQESQRAA